VASLEPDLMSGRWRKSHSYYRLDRSEKSAVKTARERLRQLGYL
jgi:hypothetical protein